MLLFKKGNYGLFCQVLKSLFCMYDQHRYLQTMPDGVDCFAIKPVFYTAVPVRTNHQ
jgi:hypothetical protein